MKKLILWCPVHTPTPEQLGDLKGFEIIRLEDISPPLFRELANCPDEPQRLEEMAKRLSVLIKDKIYTKTVLPVGSPAFNFILPLALIREDAWYGADSLGCRFHIMFSHSVKESVESHNSDGSVTKTSVFKHRKFIEL